MIYNTLLSSLMWILCVIVNNENLSTFQKTYINHRINLEENDVYLGLSQTSMMNLFCENDFHTPKMFGRVLIGPPWPTAKLLKPEINYWAFENLVAVSSTL